MASRLCLHQACTLASQAHASECCPTRGARVARCARCIASDAWPFRLAGAFGYVWEVAVGGGQWAKLRQRAAKAADALFACSDNKVVDGFWQAYDRNGGNTLYPYNTFAIDGTDQDAWFATDTQNNRHGFRRVESCDLDPETPASVASSSDPMHIGVQLIATANTCRLSPAATPNVSRSGVQLMSPASCCSNNRCSICFSDTPKVCTWFSGGPALTPLPPPFTDPNRPGQRMLPADWLAKYASGGYKQVENGRPFKWPSEVALAAFEKETKQTPLARFPDVKLAAVLDEIGDSSVTEEKLKQQMLHLHYVRLHRLEGARKAAVTRRTNAAKRKEAAAARKEVATATTTVAAVRANGQPGSRAPPRAALASGPGRASRASAGTTASSWVATKELKSSRW